MTSVSNLLKYHHRRDSAIVISLTLGCQDNVLYAGTWDMPFTKCHWIMWLLVVSGSILCMRPANVRWRYTVTPSFIGWAHAKNGHCCLRFCRPMKGVVNCINNTWCLVMFWNDIFHESLYRSLVVTIHWYLTITLQKQIFETSESVWVKWL